MKKKYETPCIEKIAFKYRDQVVVASSYIVADPCQKIHLYDSSDADAGCTHLVDKCYWSGDTKH